MRRNSVPPLFLASLLLLSFPLPSPCAFDAEKPNSNNGLFDVGVILTTSWATSPDGNMSWASMVMALQDFYTAHPNHTTRLSLHLRDTHGTDTLSAASAAIHLLRDLCVQAIVGPQTSTQLKFLLELGNKAHVPLISFTAKSPFISPIQYPYFISTAWNDSSQATVIAAIAQAFNWREVIPVFEDSDYGNAFIPYLVDALQVVDVHVRYRCKISLSAGLDQIKTALSDLSNQARFFVVHMSYYQALKLFQMATDLHMMDHGFIWMTTYSLTDIVDLFGSNATDVMQGVLGIKPYVQETSKLHKFRARWKRNYRTGKFTIIKPTVLGLWAYDTVWSLAMAVEHASTKSCTFKSSDVNNRSPDFATIEPSATGQNLLTQISATSFTGISGSFHLVDGQLESGTYEIVNVVGHVNRRVGFWTPTYGISGDLNAKVDLKQIIWPGGKNATPKGWEWPTNGPLRILVPVKAGFSEFVNYTNGTFGGYCINVFKAVMRALPYNVSYNFTPYGDSMGHSNGTYDELVYQVYLKVFPKGSPLVADVSRAILNVTESNATARYDITLYGNQSCPDKGYGVTSCSLSFHSFSGLFLITGTVSLFAVFLHVILFLHEHRHGLVTRQWFAILVKLFYEPDKAEPRATQQQEDAIRSADFTIGQESSPCFYDHGHGDVGSGSPIGTPIEEDYEAEPRTVESQEDIIHLANFSNHTLGDGDSDGPAATPGEENGSPGREPAPLFRDLPSFSAMLHDKMH